jgi:hypothetical protein
MVTTGELYWLIRRFSSPQVSFCHSKIKKDLAFISLVIVKPTIQKIALRQRITGADILGNLGKPVLALKLLKRY